MAKFTIAPNGWNPSWDRALIDVAHFLGVPNPGVQKIFVLKCPQHQYVIFVIILELTSAFSSLPFHVQTYIYSCNQIACMCR